MYARVNTIFGAEGRVGAGVARIEQSDRDAVESATGNRGLTTLVDERGGVIVLMSYWDDPRHSSAASLTRARESAASAADGDLVAENFEVIVADRSAVATPGAVVRMTRLRLEPARLGSGLTFLREELVRRLSAAGVCGTEVLVDREAGTGLLVTTWTDPDSAARAEALLDELGADTAAHAGASFPRSESYVLVRRSG